jgi:hypothetical protein
MSDKYKIVNPLDNLNDEQKKKMKELREITNKWGCAEKEQKFLDDMCLFRYLDGLHYDMDVTTKQLKETVEWRAKYNPEAITLEEYPIPLLILDLSQLQSKDICSTLDLTNMKDPSFISSWVKTKQKMMNNLNK